MTIYNIEIKMYMLLVVLFTLTCSYDDYDVSQIKARSYTVWGGLEKLEEEKQRRSEQKEKKKEKRYAKQVRGKCILIA